GAGGVHRACLCRHGGGARDQPFAPRFQLIVKVGAISSKVRRRFPYPTGWITMSINASMVARRRANEAASHQARASSEAATSASGSFERASAICCFTMVITRAISLIATFAALGDW